jgi:hypothetical protein
LTEEQTQLIMSDVLEEQNDLREEVLEALKRTPIDVKTQCMSLMAVKAHRATPEQLQTVIDMRRQELQLSGGCGGYHLCLSRLKRQRHQTHAFVNQLLRKAQGPQFAFVSGKDGLCQGVAVGDELELWFQAQKPKPADKVGEGRDNEIAQGDGVWLRGRVTAYDPKAVAWFIEFQQFDADGCVIDWDDNWFQLWRSNEHVRRHLRSTRIAVK